MLINSKELLLKAKEGKYAILQFNINNLEWTRYILETAEELQTPLILGVSEGAIRYIGGIKTTVNLVKSLIADLNIKTDIVLHLDHGSSLEMCKKCIDEGFTSVMIDASSLELEENIKITREVVNYAHKYNVTVEAEIGHIGGSEDGKHTQTYNTTLEEVQLFVNNTNIDSVAPALGSVHGFYKGEPNLDFITMEQISKNVETPLVLHGGTGIPEYQIKEAIKCGISKININTELQNVWSKAVREYLNLNKDIYDPRKIISSGEKEIKNQIKEKLKMANNI